MARNEAPDAPGPPALRQGQKSENSGKNASYDGSCDVGGARSQAPAVPCSGFPDLCLAPTKLAWRTGPTGGNLQGTEVVDVNKALAAALSCAFTAMVIVSGCNDSSEGRSRVGGRSSGGTPDPVLDGEPDDAGADPTCEDHPKVDDRPACDTCARAQCCTYVLECADSSDCEALMTCLDECEDDLACGLTCQLAHEKGGGILQELASCVQTRCKEECPSSPPDAGDFFDVL